MTFVQTNTLRCDTNTNNGRVFIARGTIVSNQWQHIVMTYDGSNMTCYINGVQAGATAAQTGTITQQTAGRIGYSGYSTEYFQGKIDDVRIYNRALSAAEVSKLYAQNETKINHSQDTRSTTGLVGFWSFNGSDMTSSTSTDVSGNGNDGGLHGGVKPVIGKVGQAAQFDGSTGYYIMQPDDTHFTTGSNGIFSFSFWVKSTNYNGTIFSRRHPCNNDGPFTIRGSGGTVTLSFYSNLDTGTFSYSSGNVLTSNVWNHVVITKQWGTAGATNLYVNGVAKTFTPSGSDSARGTTYTGLQEYIGAEASTSNCNSNNGPVGSFFNGSIDEVRIYNRILSAAEANQLYLMGK